MGVGLGWKLGLVEFRNRVWTGAEGLGHRKQEKVRNLSLLKNEGRTMGRGMYTSFMDSHCQSVLSLELY